ncbi:MAG: hypothetical protein IJI14_15870 [Anaerolineaceae bacterium]|nr:hypothetical protein [Anaerolineaceae bacterium]
MYKKTVKGQGSIELMIIAPFLIFFLAILFINGIRQNAILVANNVNYSDGIALVRSKPNSEVDTNSSNYVLQRNNSSATQSLSSADIGLGVSDPQWVKGWGGKVISNTIDPNVPSFTIVNPDELNATVAYPVSPFVSKYK